MARASLLANRIGYLFFAVAVAVFIIGFAVGFTGAIVAVAFLLTHFLTRVYGATAIFDPILALFATVLLAIAASAAGARTRMRFAALMTAAGVAGALAFQTRLNGLLFFAVTLLVVLTVPRPRSDTIIGFAAAGAAFVVVTLAVGSSVTRVRVTGAGQAALPSTQTIAAGAVDAVGRVSSLYAVTVDYGKGRTLYYVDPAHQATEMVFLSPAGAMQDVYAVRAGRPSDRTAMRVRRCGDRPIGASTTPRRAAGTPHTNAS